MSAFKQFLQNFATGSGTASCQDYVEYEFVECLTEKTRIIDHISFLNLHALNSSEFLLVLDSIR